MLYLIYAQDNDNSLAKRLENRPAHLARLEQLQEQGRLIIAGPCPAIDSSEPAEAGFTGSMIVAEFESLTQAQDWANSDPYLTAKVYQSVTVKPYLKVLPK